MRIDEATLVVVDTETTGTNARQDRLIEVAAVRVRGGQIEDTFTRLINPGRSVPRRITRLTGISTGMVFDQPPISDVLPAFLAFLGSDVLVAHNLGFDLRFLNAELERAGLDVLENDTLCTLRLARRLLPGLPSKGLSSLVSFFDIRVRQRHRALGDAQATVAVLSRLLRQAQHEYDVDDLDDLLRFQHRAYASLRKAPAHLRRIRDEVLPSLPATPGVYFMKDRRDAVIYIGKAKSLRDRVRSYFTGVEGHPPRIRKLVNAVRDVAWVETGSELGALLRESRLIKEHTPKFNRAQRRYRNRPFIRLDAAHEAPRVTVSRYVQNDGAEYFGPLGGRRQAELVAGVIDTFFRLRACDDDTFRQGRRCLYASMGRCTAPCVDADASATYTAEVERVRAFLTGRDRAVLAHIEEEMREAAARMEYEQAATFRDWLRRLEALMGRQQAVAAPVLAHNAAHVQPGEEPGTAQVFLVRFGRLVATAVLGLDPSDAEIRRLRDLVATHFDAAQQRPERYLKREVEEVRILATWLSQHHRDGDAVRWQPELDPSAFVEGVLRLVDARSRTRPV